MTLQSIADKVVPSLLVLIIASIAGLILEVKSNGSKVYELESVAKDNRERVDKSNYEQWKYIADIKDRTSRLEERCVSKDQFYKDIK